MRVHILRIRKGVPGIGRKMGQWLNERGIDTQEVVCNKAPVIPVQPEDVIFNYGRSDLPVWATHGMLRQFLNTPDAVSKCVNKITTLTELTQAGVPCIEWTVSARQAFDWCRAGEVSIAGFARTLINGKQGKGIELFYHGTEYSHEGDVFPDAPLYTKQFPENPANKREFRVHVFKGKVIDYVQKKRMSTAKLAARGYKRNEDVRNKKNGWVFAHNEIIDSQLVSTIAVQAANALGMDYCGVDVIGEWSNEAQSIVDAKVCEVNSAPGMSNQKTIDAYVSAITDYVKRR